MMNSRSHHASGRQVRLAVSIVVVMGVSGSGKTTVGTCLAERLKWKFYDADSFHSSAAVEKMSQGIALTDQDRLPWLQRLRSLLEECGQRGQGAVLACSSLKKHYRRLIVPEEMSGQVGWIYLKGSRELIERRMRQRAEHFFEPGLLESQFAALEEPDEAVTLDIRNSVEILVEQAVAAFRLQQ